MNKSVCVFALLISSILIPTLLLADDQQTAESSIRALKKMSPVERDQFDRNLIAFQQMSSDQKAGYRKLHDDLKKEFKESGGALSALMETYSVWLMTLSPKQRDELQQETDLSKKLAIVRRFKEEQDRSNEHSEATHDEPAAPVAPKNVAKLAMDKKDLDAAFRVIVDSLPLDRKKAEFDEIGLTTYLPILHESVQLFGNTHEWPGDGLQPKLLSAIRKETSKEIQRSSSKRDALIRMMLMGILKIAHEQIHEPTADERTKTALDLSPEDRAKLNKLPQQQIKSAIRAKYFESKGEEGRKQLLQLTMYRRQVVEMFEILGVEVPPNIKRPDRLPRGKGL